MAEDVSQVPMASQDHGTRLTGLTISFKDGHRRHRLDVTLTTNNQEIGLTVEKDGNALLEEEIILRSDIVVVRVRWRSHRGFGKRKTVVLQANVWEHTRDINIDVSDDKGKVMVTLRLKHVLRDDPVATSSAVSTSIPSPLVGADLLPRPRPPRIVDQSVEDENEGDALLHPPLSADQAEIQAAKKRLSEKKLVLSKRMEPFMGAFDIVKAAVNIATNAHPAVGLVVGAMDSLMKVCESQKAAWEAATDLIEGFEAFPDLHDYKKEVEERQETRRAVARMMEVIKTSCEYVCDHTSTGRLGNLFGTEYKNKIKEYQGDFTKAKETFDRSIALGMFKVIHGIEWSSQLDTLTKNLDVRDIANFRMGAEHTCLPGTRVGLCAEIEIWIYALDPRLSKAKGLWLHGMAGSGKSTVANTIATLAQRCGTLLSTFVCKRDDAYLSDPRKILPLLAYRFAQQHDSYRVALVDFIQSGTSESVGLAESVDIPTQLDRLFTTLLPSTIDPLRWHLIVVDALDECGTPTQRRQLLKALFDLSRMVPWIKVLITSRNEAEIKDVVVAAEADDEAVSLDINQDRDTTKDIQLYIESWSRPEYLNLTPPLSQDEVECLSGLADGLFIWTSTLYRVLSKALVPRKALKPFLESRAGNGQKLVPLHELYTQVLDIAMSSPEDRPLLHTILSIIYLVSQHRPLCVSAIAAFVTRHPAHANRDADEVDVAVHRLHAVLTIDSNDVVRAYHASVYDFVHDRLQTASDWPEYFETQHHIVQGCLSIMDDQLRFNICKLERPVLNKQIPDLYRRICDNISPELQYSTLFWARHLSPDVSKDTDLKGSIASLLSTGKLLFWLECISLQNAVPTAAAALVHVEEIFETLRDRASDVRRSLAAFGDALDSAPHVYNSYIVWLPKTSLTSDAISPLFPHADIISDKKLKWDAGVVWERATGSNAYCVSFSPDGRVVACGTSSGSVFTWDSQSGTPIGAPLCTQPGRVCSIAYSRDGSCVATGSTYGNIYRWNSASGKSHGIPLKGHSDTVWSVTFSPDGSTLASASADGTVRRWDTITCEPIGDPLRGHHARVYAVTYSPDGRLLVSASGDGNVCFWNAATGTPDGEPLQGHSDSVQTVSFSPDGLSLASGSDDNTVLIWDVASRTQIAELSGHTHWVRSVAYSPDGRSIASASEDGTVVVWDTATHKAIGNPLPHSGSVYGVTYLPNGRLLASCTGDGMVRVWDTSATADQPPSPATSSDSRIYALSISPNGRVIASGGNDGKVSLWDASTGTLTGTLQTFDDYSGDVNAIAYSPSGKWIASGHDDGAVRLWNAAEHSLFQKPLRGHSDYIWSVAFTPDSQRIISGGADTTVQIWSIASGLPVCEPLHGHTDAVLSVACSLDGLLIASGSDDATVRLWNVATGTIARDPLQGHFNGVNSVAFSPDGHFLASGSDDLTIRVWDTATGEIVSSPLKGHSKQVMRVTYTADGRFIVSGSAGGTICVWDAQTGELVAEPLRGHSDWVLSVAGSPNGQFFASAGDKGTIFIYDTPYDAHLNASAYRTWWNVCLRMKEDGWVRDDDGTLLLWVPRAYRARFREHARLVIRKGVATPLPHVVRPEILVEYSGENWTKVFSDSVANASAYNN